MTTNGELYCWGDNEYGKVGNGTRDTQLTPVKILDNINSFSLKINTAAAITTNRELYCWEQQLWPSRGMELEILN